ncbi:MAG: hypothetical protein RLZZ126_235 [Pseudomonadota bacterium]
MTHPLPTARQTTRSDGAEARARLLSSAVELFAQQGFANTSTREIAQAAGVNIAAISYYFGDKAGLYRAAFLEPMQSHRSTLNEFSSPALSLADALHCFYSSFMAPLKQGPQMQHCVRLHLREMVEPTGLWDEVVRNEIKPSNQALRGVLCRHLGLKRADEDLHRLAFAIVGQVVYLLIGREVVSSIAPRLLGSPSGIDKTTQRLTDQALAMVEAERVRRATP